MKKRILVLLTVALVMAAMLLSSAFPALAAKPLVLCPEPGQEPGPLGTTTPPDFVIVGVPLDTGNPDTGPCQVIT